MKKIINKFKETLGFKVVVGVMTFLMTNIVSVDKEPTVIKKVKENFSTEIAFEKKFFEVKSIYLDNNLNY